MWVSIAGPLSNLLMAIIAAIPFQTGLVQYTGLRGDILPTLPYFLFEFILINLFLMLLHILGGRGE